MQTIHESSENWNPNGDTAKKREILTATRRHPSIHHTAPCENTNVARVSSILTGATSTNVKFDRLEIVRTLGEGSFGEVVLVVDKDDRNTAYAVKRIGLIGLSSDEQKNVKKEAAIQKTLLGCRNILGYVACRTIDNIAELYIEYADGGELFDRIEPDYGMEPRLAQCYYRQLLVGLNFMHRKNIVHRDIKPENLLLTKQHCLKICDFGMATVYRTRERERLLETRCGTLPYAAPEIFLGSYRGPPIDIWSSAVVLITMLVGELPWDEATPKCSAYQAFLRNDLSRRPWCRLQTSELAFLRMILNPTFQQRPTMRRIACHPWFSTDLPALNDWHREIPIHAMPAVLPRLKGPRVESGSASQPAKLISLQGRNNFFVNNVKLNTIDSKPAIGFSQPIVREHDLLSGSQMTQMLGSQVHPLALLVRRMTRFCLNVDIATAITTIQQVLQNRDFEVRQDNFYQLFATSRSVEELSFVVNVFELVENNMRTVLADFRRSRGDGLEFKRYFLLVRSDLSNLISRDSMDWLARYQLLDEPDLSSVVRDVAAEHSSQLSQVRSGI